MIYAILVVLGLAFGSFVNALVWRLHAKKDWVKARSECTSCGHELGAIDLVPVISWLLLRGKCRYCHKPISWQYPLVELLTTGLFLLSYVAWPEPLSASFTLLLPFVVWLICIIGLVAICVYDIRWFLIPDSILYPLIYLGVTWIAYTAVFLDGGPLLIRDRVLGVLIGGGIFYATYQLSKGKWIGGGDVKLGILIGLLLGARDSFIALYAASIFGAVVMVSLLLVKKVTRKSKIPFGPFLVAGMIIARLFGLSIWQWYKRRFTA